MKTNQSGFTLVEIAIVLVIIGLLLGGVLKGQELIQSAKIKNVVNDFTATTTAIYGYQDRYKALPGDDSGAVARWTSAPAGAIVDGNNDRILNLNSTTACVFSDTAVATAGECFYFWTHLRQSGFITGELTSGPPQNAYGGALGVQNGNDALQSAAGAGSGFKGAIICQSNIPDKAAIALDNQLDDGNPSTGSVRAIEQDNATTAKAVSAVAAQAAYEETGTKYYTICKAL